VCRTRDRVGTDGALEVVELVAKGGGGNQAIIDGPDRDAVPGERHYALGGFVRLVAAAPTAAVHVDDQRCVVIWRAVDVQLQRGVTDRGDHMTATVMGLIGQAVR
jgi:hypothetical protein